jgi:hypothetical protein
VGKDSPGERNLPIKVIFQGANSSGIAPQEASSSNKPMEGGDLKIRASKNRQASAGKNKVALGTYSNQEM